jgi:hypothetical protein
VARSIIGSSVWLFWPELPRSRALFCGSLTKLNLTNLYATYAGPKHWNGSVEWAGKTIERNDRKGRSHSIRNAKETMFHTPILSLRYSDRSHKLRRSDHARQFSFSNHTSLGIPVGTALVPRDNQSFLGLFARRAAHCPSPVGVGPVRVGPVRAGPVGAGPVRAASDRPQSPLRRFNGKFR